MDLDAWDRATWPVACRLLPGITRRRFERSTVREIEDRIAGAKWRLGMRYDQIVFQVVQMLRKWGQGEMLSHQTMLGRDPLDPDERGKPPAPPVATPDRQPMLTSVAPEPSGDPESKVSRGFAMLAGASRRKQERERAERKKGKGPRAPERAPDG